MNPASIRVGLSWLKLSRGSWGALASWPELCLLGLLTMLWPASNGLAQPDQAEGQGTPDSAEETAPPRELVFYNWTAYVDQDVVKAFERTYNARVVQRYFQSADERDETLMRNKGKGFDVLTVTAADLPPYIQHGWLQPLDKSAIPNLVHVDRRWIDGFEGVDDYAVPYLWGTTGLIWRSDLVDEPLRRWGQYYVPKKAWKGHMMVLNQYRVAFGMALKSLGYSFNSTEPAEIEDAARLLRAQKPFVQNYGYFKTDANSGIVSGETWIGQTWNGDALLLMERNPAIRYRVPEEGGELMIDYLVITAKARDPELANAFINWLHTPAHAAACAESLRFATTNLAANALLPDDFLNNPVIYPPTEVLERSEVQKPLPTEVQHQMISIWAQLIN
ncbi:extracellular solute-binding protein family 1 [Thiorhodococcus drewsii AZ1]|uniref:Putrescine-binding periplasmic protein n=1 Tax=Thiorhodococcus drewsii AZ1 TaxID=765913 RepID=G2DXX3_9GAMM|nr:spermidine/putrescine ABC transporter substrate-binding protein [Thiorhodococcus drewsii]EGV32765.1 extracellular solute-binding protein family 1 [Thiorhodococcus drewsii AZ1]